MHLKSVLKNKSKVIHHLPVTVLVCLVLFAAIWALIEAFVFVQTNASPDQGYSDPHFVANRSVVVQIMEWKYSEIAKECETFLGPYGYGGVQVSPVSENAVIERRPWWERYQPVSYKIITRSGDERQFADMVRRCNKVGVRIYVDIVLNHMTGGQRGKGTAGSDFDGDKLKYEGVPYSSLDFHGHDSCPTKDMDIHNYDNEIEVRNCRLSGLRDLNQGKDHVREKQVAFLNRLIDIGVAGFRSDASKHQWPTDLKHIYSRLHDLNTTFFKPNSKPFVYHEVIQYSAGSRFTKQYLDIGRVIEFRYYRSLCQVFRKHNNQRLKYLKNFGEDWGFLSTGDAFVMIDSHDLQRGHNGDLGVNIAYFEPKLLKMSTAFMLAWPFGVPRVMSSYYWPRKIQNNKDSNDWMGPPNTNGVIHDVVRNPDLTCNTSEWICEHRWRQIYNMVRFRNIAANDKVDNWWDNDFHSIAFSRGNNAFIAINNDIQPIDTTLKTGLPAGQYCDIISGNLIDGKCSGKQVTVNSDGSARIFVDSKWEDPMIAFHIRSKM